jgi:hypothetical protein
VSDRSTRVSPARDGTAMPTKAVLALVDAPDERVTVGWNPSSYAVKRTRMEPGGSPWPVRTDIDELSTELFVDTSDRVGEERDGRRFSENLRRWMAPARGSFRPPKVMLVWGNLRFAGTIVEVDEKWWRFDPDGTPVRGTIRIVLRN